MVSMIFGFPLFGAGVLIGLGSIGLGIGGAIKIDRAIERYNRFSAEGPSLAELRLELAPTPGELGLQLTF
jgi:F0F1-type ATP synthase membrane subunit c/vacuolar-type H+-ATPase subunit K